jgi:hypothetical protein
MEVPTGSGWDRLQALLEGLRPGEELHIGDVVQRSGLDAMTCESVLEALSRLEFFRRSGNHLFVRQQALEPNRQGGTSSAG